MLSSISTYSFSQKEPVKINGRAQGVAYNITYFDKNNRDFKPEIEKLLKDFDKSVSLWDSTSIMESFSDFEASMRWAM